MSEMIIKNEGNVEKRPLNITTLHLSFGVALRMTNSNANCELF